MDFEAAIIVEYNICADTYEVVELKNCWEPKIGSLLKEEELREIVGRRLVHTNVYIRKPKGPNYINVWPNAWPKWPHEPEISISYEGPTQYPWCYMGT